MVCTTKDLYKSVRKCPGVRITPGIRPKFLAILKSKILTWPKLPDDIEDKATEQHRIRRALTQNSRRRKRKLFSKS